MARMLRIEYPGAFYHHVMARGKRRETVFHDDDDRKFFLATLGEVCSILEKLSSFSLQVYMPRATAHPIGPSCPQGAAECACP